jgi:replicative DNA helicase
MGNTTQGERIPGLLRFIASVGASTFVATLLTAGLTYYQIRAARADNSASIRRDALVQLQDSLVELVNAQKTIYLITLKNFRKTGKWTSQLDLNAEQKRAHADTKVDAFLVRVNDQVLTESVRAMQKNVFQVANTVSREDAEKLSVILDKNFEISQQRAGALFVELRNVPLSSRILDRIFGKD